MSTLSGLIWKPYKGLAPNAGGLGYTLAQPTFLIESSDATAGGDGYPKLTLRADHQATTAGGMHVWSNLNASAAYVNAATVQATLAALTAGAESAVLAFTVLAAGSPKSVQFRGDVSAITPAVTGGWSLGNAALRFASVYIGNGTINGELSQDGTEVSVGSSSAHSLAFKTNNVVRAQIDASGRWGIIGAPVAAATVSISGAHPSSGTTLYGVAITQTDPATGTNYSALYVQPTTTAAVYNSTLYGVDIADAVKGAGSTILNQYGVRVGALASGESNIGIHVAVDGVANGNHRAIYCFGSAPSQFMGPVGIMGAQVDGDGDLFVTHNFADAKDTARLKSLQTGYTGALLALQAIGDGASYLIRGIDATAGHPLLVLDNGQMVLQGKGGVLGPQNGAQLTVIGRLFQPISPLTHNLFGGTAWAVTSLLYDSGTTAVVGANKQFAANCVAFTNLTVDALSNAHGYFVNVGTGVSGASSTIIDGFGVTMTDTGSGQLYGFNASLIGGSGTVAGVHCVVDGAAAATSSLFHGATNIDADNGLWLTAVAAGNTLAYGVKIESGILLGQAALHYTQRSTSTAAFLTYVNSLGTTAFNVDSAGDVFRAGSKVLSTRRTGWAAWTGTATRTAIATGSATATNVAEAVKGLIDDLIAHGIIGA